MDKTTEIATEANARSLEIEGVPGPLRGPLRNFDKHRKNFYVVIGAALFGFLANAIAGDLYNRYKPWRESDDEFVQKIALAQKQDFEFLRASLGDIRSSLPVDSKDAFNSIERALANVERGSAGLVNQLDLAKGEIETMRAVSLNRSGVGSGYDFILSEHRSMDLAPGALLGLTNVGGNGVYVNLTSSGETIAKHEYLRAGETLKFSGNAGAECWVSLRSHQNGRPGTASFNTSCA